MPKIHHQRGASALEPLLIIAVLIVIIFIAPKGNNTWGPSTNTSPSGSYSASEGPSPSSPFANSISLSSGNASYAYQPNEEYITLRNNGREAVNITGWYLKNKKDERAYYLGGNLQNFPPDIVYIGRGTKSISPNGNSVMEDIVLLPRDSAIVVTGKMGSQLPYQIVSFKESMCTGYFANMREYSFNPTLSRNCPQPSEEPGLENLDIECRRFVERMSACHVPTFDTRDREGNSCATCVDSTRLSSACYAFIKERISYPSCVARFSNSNDFSGSTWRIFLGRGWEMWAKEYEAIELYDNLGRLVARYSY